MKKEEIKKGEIIIYKTSTGPKLEVRLEKDTIWLTQAQIATLFNTERSVITKHLKNIFKYGELNRKSVSSILEHTASDGKNYKTQFYSLDAIISVGYRVNSGRATQLNNSYLSCISYTWQNAGMGASIPALPPILNAD